MICENCEKEVDRDEVARVYGAFLADQGYCSASCYTDAMTMAGAQAHKNDDADGVTS